MEFPVKLDVLLNLESKCLVYLFVADSIRLEKIAVGSTRIGKGMEDLLDAEIGKHDYDW